MAEEVGQFPQRAWITGRATPDHEKHQVEFRRRHRVDPLGFEPVRRLDVEKVVRVAEAIRFPIRIRILEVLADKRARILNGGSKLRPTPEMFGVSATAMCDELEDGEGDMQAYYSHYRRLKELRMIVQVSGPTENGGKGERGFALTQDGLVAARVAEMVAGADL